MKTPREILIAGHRSAEPQLDAIRRQVLRPAGESPHGEKPVFSRVIESCREFVRLPRLAWAGFAAAWFVIIALNIASSDTGQMNVSATRAPAERSPEMLQALREQKRLFAELVGPFPADAEAPRFVPRPRSAHQSQLSYA